MLELHDIQGIVVRGYHMMMANYSFFGFDSPESGRAWLAEITKHVTDAHEWEAKPAHCVNVGLSYAGLERLGMPEESLASFPVEFREGMAGRAKLLGDVGTNDPKYWEEGGPENPDLHALVMVHANHQEILKEQQAVIDGIARNLGLAQVKTIEARTCAGDREHFGYRDGLTKVVVRGSNQPVQPGGKLIEPGEFILGYPDEVQALPASPVPEAIGRNGSYLVYRRLHQDVAAFRKFLAEAARDMNRDVEWVAAKLMGRWRSGAPLVLAPDRDDPDLGNDPNRQNGFDFTDDERGYLCPRGAHIRRGNPRSLKGELGRYRHLVQRRGLPYGDALPEGAKDDDLPRGVVGVMINASLSRQFEFVQSEWINNSRFGDLENEHDPITGYNDGTGDLTISRRPIKKVFHNLPGFTTVKGGGYFFAPGMSALEFISSQS